MPISSKAKGARLERQLAGIFRDYGFDARRTAQYCGCCEDEVVTAEWCEVIGNIHDNPELIAEV